MTRPSASVLALFAVLSCSGIGLGGACSSTAEPGADAGGTGGTTTGAGGNGAGGDSGAGGNGACASAVDGAACTTEGTTCSQGCADVCSFCNSLRCTGGHWIGQEAFPAPCFDCGPALRCQINVAMCVETTGGAAGNPPYYRCQPVPERCRATPTCACIAPPPSVCEESGAGQVKTTLLAP